MVDGKSVGLTPLLLLVGPGKYHVEMRGQHQEFGGGDVESACSSKSLRLTSSGGGPDAVAAPGIAPVRDAAAAGTMAAFALPSNLGITASVGFGCTVTRVTKRGVSVSKYSRV